MIDPAAFAAAADGLTPDVLRRKRSAKWAGVPDDVLPAWVADLDLPLCDAVLSAIHSAVDRGDLGYLVEDSTAPSAWADWCRRRYGWTPDVTYASPHGSAVAALAACVDLLTAPGEQIVVPVPAYPPFRLVAGDLGRRHVEVPLLVDDAGRNAFDLDRIAAALDAGARMVLLCSPHNPTGQSWSATHLRALADLAVAHDAWLVSDEVHADLTLPGARHVPTASLGPQIAARTVTLTSASKAFGITGLKYALAIVPDEETHHRFLHRRHTRGATPGILGALAAEAAWRHGDAWLDAVLAYLDARRAQVAASLPKLTGVRWVPNEATYFAWLDLRATPFAGDPAASLLTHARLQLSGGDAFGAPGFARLNTALPRPVLGDALDRLARALGPIRVPDLNP
jgi:cysteine-S-conjugate beta-lyase